MSDMPEILAVKKSKEMWAAYLCRSGLGGRSDTNYYREDYVKDLHEQLEQKDKSLLNLTEDYAALLDKLEQKDNG